MSITDELRGYVQDWRDTPSLMDDLDRGDIDGIFEDFIRIADRIDEQHRRGMATAQQVGYNEGEDAAMRDGWAKLPVDADGVPIRIGDELDVGFVARIVITDDEWPPYLYAYKETPHILLQHFCSDVSHYHEPTVDDVLREIVRKCQPTYSKDGSYTTGLTKEEFAEYAAKLRLAGETE